MALLRHKYLISTLTAVVLVVSGLVWLLVSGRGSKDWPEPSTLTALGDSAPEDTVPGKDHDAVPGKSCTPEIPPSIHKPSEELSKGSAMLFGRVSHKSTAGGVEEPLVGAIVRAISERCLLDLESKESPRRAVSSHEERAALLRRRIENLIESAPSALTDASGDYRITGLDARAYRLYVRESTHIAASGPRVALRPGEKRRLDFVLAEGASIAGRVVDENGVGIGKATVEVELSQAAAARGLGRLLRSTHLLSSTDLSSLRRSTISDADGVFRLSGLGQLLHHVRARASGYAETELLDVEPGTENLEIRLESGGKITGTIRTAKGIEVSGVTVHAVREENGAAFLNGATDDTSAGTPTKREAVYPAHDSPDADGAFTLHSLTAGWYHVAVTGEDVQPALCELVEVRPGQTTDVGIVRVRADIPISGSVLAPSGRPVENATVRAVPAGTGRAEWSYLAVPSAALTSARTDAKGRFELGGLPAGNYDIEAWSCEFAAGLERYISAGTHDLEFRLRNGHSVTGVVLNGLDDTPVPDARISTFPAQEAITDSTGTFQLYGLTGDAEGSFSLILTIESEDYGTQRRIFEIDPEVREKPIEIRLMPSFVLAGTVSDDQGAPVDGATVRLLVPGATDQPSGPAASTSSDAKGNFQIVVDTLRSRDSATKPILFAQHPDKGVGQSHGIDEKSMDDRRGFYELVLSRGVAIHGRVLDDTGTAVVGASLKLSHVPILSRRTLKASAAGTLEVVDTVRSGEGGDYSIGGLLPGTYRLDVHHGHYSPSRISFTVEGQGDLEENITLESEKFIRGRVLDSSRNPIANVEVVAAVVDRHLLTPPPDLAMAYGITGGVSRTRSLEDGSFVLAKVPGSPVTVVARARGYRIAFVEGVTAMDESVELVLTRLSVVQISVRDATTQAPIEAYDIALTFVREVDSSASATGVHPAFHAWGLGGEGFRNIRDQDGLCLLHRVPPGVFDLRIEAAGYDADEQRLTIRPGDDRVLEVSLTPGVWVSGRVLRAEDERPLEGATIQLLEYAKFKGQIRIVRASALWRTRTGIDGRFVLHGIPRGNYQVEVSCTGRARWVLPALGVHEGIELEPIALHSSANLQLRIRGLPSYRPGTLEPEVGLEPVANAESGRDAPVAFGVRMTDGTYQFRGISPGTFSVVVSIPGYRAFRGPTLRLEPSQELTATVDFQGEKL